MKKSLVALQTITYKEIHRFLRIWTQTLLPPVINQSLYFVIFGEVFAGRLEGGIKYIQFIVPGLIMMAIINSSYANVSSSFFGAKFQNSIEEIQVSPTPNWVILLGYSIGGVIRGLMIGMVVFVISMLFTKPEISNLAIVLIFSLLSSMVFSLGGFANGLFANKFDHVTIVPAFIITPLTYLGGVFYSIQDFDSIWQNLSKLNPILYMVNGFRYGFFGVSDVDIWISMGMLLSFVVILFITNMWFLNRGTGLRS